MVHPPKREDRVYKEKAHTFFIKKKYNSIFLYKYYTECITRMKFNTLRAPNVFKALLTNVVKSIRRNEAQKLNITSKLRCTKGTSLI